MNVYFYWFVFRAASISDNKRCLMKDCSDNESTIKLSPTDNNIITLNVGGQRFSTSRSTLTWIPNTFFTSLLSGRINSVEDDTGAKFIDRDPKLFRRILNYLRTKQIDLRLVSFNLI